MVEMELRLASLEDKLSVMQAQISNLLRLQRLLLEGHMKINDDGVVMCREHIALCQCLNSEGLVARSVLEAYVTAQRVSDQFHSCMHDPHIARRVLQGAGLMTAGHLSAASSICRSHFLGYAVLGERLDELSTSITSLCRSFGGNSPWTPLCLTGLDAALAERGIADAFVSVAGVRDTVRLSMACRFCRSSLLAASRKARAGCDKLEVKPFYIMLRERRAGGLLASCMGSMGVCDFAAASWACKSSLHGRRWRFLGRPAAPRRSRMRAMMPVKKAGCTPRATCKIHAILHMPRVTLALVKFLSSGGNATGLIAAASWPFACVDPIAAHVRMRVSAKIRRGQTPDPVYCSAGGHSGPDFEHTIEFTGAKLPQAPLTLAARIRTSSEACQVIAGWGSEDGCASAELRLKYGNLEYLERSGMWWGWKSVAAHGELDLADGAWHGVVAVRLASGEVDLYADGACIGGGMMSADTPAGLRATAKSAHLHRSWNGYAFNGEIGPLFIYDCALSFKQLCESGIFPSPTMERRRAYSSHESTRRPSLGTELAIRTFRSHKFGRLEMQSFRLGLMGPIAGSTHCQQGPTSPWPTTPFGLVNMDGSGIADDFECEVKRKGVRGRGCL